MFPLLLKDYKTILNYYNIDYTNLSNKNIKKKAEDILADKLCRCIKKVDTENEKRSIPICKDSIFKKKGLHIYRFTCKNKPSLKPKKKTKRKLSKFNKTFKLK
jgi:hypothetical protein